MRRSLVVLMRLSFVVVVLLLVIAVEYKKKTLEFNTTDVYELLGRLRGPLKWDDSKTLETLRLKYLVPPSSIPLNLTDTADIKYHTHKGKYEWKFFHHYNRQFFSQQKSGFFVEAGALDGEFLSNTLWLEQTQGWSGLLIEADKLNFQYLIWKRRRAWISNTCISEELYPKEVVFESLQQNADGFAVPWLYRANSRVLNTYFSKINDGYKETSAIYYSNVQCFPLVSYLLALNITTVDYLSLDIQGNEWEVIKTLPLDKISVRVMAIEHFIDADNFQDGSHVDDKFLLYMKGINYRLIDIDEKTNYLFVLENDSIVENSVILFKKH